MGRLAERVGVSPTYLSHILAGRRVPKLDVAVKLAKELGVGVGELKGEMERYRRAS